MMLTMSKCTKEVVVFRLTQFNIMWVVGLKNTKNITNPRLKHAIVLKPTMCSTTATNVSRYDVCRCSMQYVHCTDITCKIYMHGVIVKLGGVWMFLR